MIQRLRVRIGFPSLLTIGLTLLIAAAAGASLPGGRVPGSRLVAPVSGARVYAGELRFAWTPPAGSVRHVLVASREPFDARSWTRLPQAAGFRVLETAKPVASLAELGWSQDQESDLYWAAGSADSRTGRLTFSETRLCHVIPRFANHLEPTPYLQASPIGRAEPGTNAEPDRIRLASGYTIDPAAGEPALPAALRASGQAPGAVRSFLVYYGSQDPDAARERILASGASIVSYIPDHTFLVRLKPEASLTMEGAAAWVGQYQPAYKLSTRDLVTSESVTTATVLAFPDGDLASIAAAVRAAGGTVVTTSDNGINRILRAKLPGTAMAGLAQHPDVEWIEPYVQPTTSNFSVQWVVQTFVNGNRRLWDLGLHGEGQVIHHSDSGIDVTHELFTDPLVPITDFGEYPTHRKVIAYQRGGDDPGIVFGDQASASYHGSHTSGTVAGGDPVPPTSIYEGVAKAAKIWHMDMSGPAMGTGLAPFADLNDLFQPAYTGNAGGAARLSTNSWGAPVAGAYDVEAFNVDQFMWNHPDFLIFFANGNSSTANSVGSPATSKNSVGAGGTRNGTSANLIYSSTSRGPTADGRRKPTICAPGQTVTSAQNGPANYATLSGTSMATPSMTGAAALIRQYCTEGWYPTGTKVPANGFSPSAALLKAMCVNSAANQVTGFTAPDNNIGWGRICADSVCYFAGDKRRLLLVDQVTGLAHGQSIQYHVNVVNDSTPLEVTLCWTDYPGGVAASVELVNDLNLTVTNGVSTYKGNVYAGGFSVTGGSADNRNVEEAVLVKTPSVGTWTITVDAPNVPIGPQPFGLCITGGVGAQAGAVALDRAEYGSSSTVQVRVEDTNAGGSVNVSLTTPTEPAGETLNLPGSNGVYAGSIPLSAVGGTSGDGTLQVSHGDVITATYNDANPVTTATATATVSFNAPLISNVLALSPASGVATVTWATDEGASSKVYYGPTPALGSATTVDPVVSLGHSENVTGLTPGQTYYYDVESQDLKGNTTRDDNGGQHYRFTVRAPGNLLLIYGNDAFERPGRYDAALNALGWFYDTWSGSLSANPAVGGLTSGMRSYDVVWYQPGLEQYPPVSDAGRDSIDLYLNGGGRFSIEGQDLGWSNSDPSSPYYTAARQLWVQNTLHSSFVADPPGWTQVIGIGGDPISDAYTAGLPYQEHRAGASGDEIDPVAPAVTSWLSNDGSPYSCAVRWESGGPVGTPGSGVWGGKNSRMTAMYFEWTDIDPFLEVSTLRRDVLQKTLTWLMGRDKPNVTITAPNGGETITTATTPITWTETTDGASPASRLIEYSADGGQSWTTIATGVGPSPYTWNLSGVPNSGTALVRVRLTDNGSPAFTGYDVSDAQFSIQRPGADLVGPVAQAGSVRVSPNPIVNGVAATLTATLTDSHTGGSNVVQAEWSSGASPAPAGTGQPMSGAFSSPTEAVSAALPTAHFPVGNRTLWVRGRDAAGNWGGASSLTVVVNHNSTLATDDGLPHALELRQNAPNPVLQTTVIGFALPSEANVSLSIYDVGGRRVKSLVHDRLAPGVHTVPWNRSDDAGHVVRPGVYYYRMDVAGKAFQKKIVVLE